MTCFGAKESKNQKLSWFTERVAKQYFEIAPKVDSKSKEIIQRVVQQHATCGTSTIEVSSDIIWEPYPNDPEAEHIFTHKTPTNGKPIFFTGLPNKCHLSRAANSFMGSYAVMTCTQGVMFVILLNPSHVQAMGAGDVGLYLNSLKGDALSDSPSYILTPGQAVYWPFGWAALYIGIMGSCETSPELIEDKRVAKRKRPDTFSTAGVYSFTLNFNLDFDHKCLELELVSSATSIMHSSQTHFPPSFRKYTADYRQHLISEPDVGSHPGGGEETTQNPQDI